MKIPSCAICDSTNYTGSFSAIIHDKPIMVCRVCSDSIRSVHDVRDTQYDELISALKGRRYVLINTQRDGGYKLSHHALIEYCERLNMPYQIKPRIDRSQNEREGPMVIAQDDPMWHLSIPRDDPVLIKVVRDLGDKANGWKSVLKVVGIPRDVDWVVESFLGEEWIAERHRVWY